MKDYYNQIEKLNWTQIEEGKIKLDKKGQGSHVPKF